MFIEANEGPYTIDAQIPISKNVHILSRHLKAGDSDTVVYVVGGAVRDYLNNKKPKDIDLTTNISGKEILERLRTPEAQQDGIKVKEKETETFGVVFVTMPEVDGEDGEVDGEDGEVDGEDGEYNKVDEYEIAPFRKDVGIADGRRPEKTERGTIYDDSMRRDLTMNNLYYDFDNHKILDYNPNGQGIEDIKNGVARTVGNPFERFNEDKLRVLRLVRFFSRFNAGNIIEKLDSNTRDAIEKYKNLQSHGITPERIFQELVGQVDRKGKRKGGIYHSMITSSFLKNLTSLDLMKSIFPNLNVDIQGIDRLGNCKNVNVILAWLLRNNKNVGEKLKNLTYPSEITTSVELLLQLYEKFKNSGNQFSKIHALTKERDKYLPNIPKISELESLGEKKSREKLELKRQKMSAKMQQDINEFSKVLGVDLNTDRFTHFASYKPMQIDTQELISRGLKGPEIGQEQNKVRDQHYNQSFEDFLKKKQ